MLHQDNPTVPLLWSYARAKTACRVIMYVGTPFTPQLHLSAELGVYTQTLSFTSQIICSYSKHCHCCLWCLHTQLCPKTSFSNPHQLVLECVWSSSFFVGPNITPLLALTAFLEGCELLAQLSRELQHLCCVSNLTEGGQQVQSSQRFGNRGGMTKSCFFRKLG